MTYDEVNTIKPQKKRVTAVYMKYMKCGLRDRKQDDNTIHQLEHNETSQYCSVWCSYVGKEI